MTTLGATGVLREMWLLIAFPLFGAAVLLLGGRRTDKWGHLLGVLMPIASFVYAVIAFFTLLGETDRSRDLHMFTYIPVGGFQVNFGLLLDPLSGNAVLNGIPVELVRPHARALSPTRALSTGAPPR